nr:hypothetical protein [candidate division Zixibacteria bacterium]
MSTPRMLFAALLMMAITASVGQPQTGEGLMDQPVKKQQPPKATIIFAVFAANDEELNNICYLAESIRQFGGRFREAPIRVYTPDNTTMTDSTLKNKLSSLGIEFKTVSVPKESHWFYYAGKVYAAARAETEAVGKTEVLIWMDEDTIVLEEPEKFKLDPQIGFAYRPVMHNRSGSPYSQPPDKFWERIYRLLEIDDSLLFSMVTPADKQTIRAYFNAGLLVVRPEHGILRNWATGFKILYSDPILAEMCRNNVTHRIFLHQTALVGALKLLDRKQMMELPEDYNYPLFFHRMFEAAGEFESIEGIVTLRYDVYFRDPDPDWASKLKGSPGKIAWLAERLGRK